MKYVVEIEINKPQAEVAWGYVNLEKMYAWEKGLKRIEHQKGKLFDTGSIGHLVFEFNGVEMPMKVTVEMNNLNPSAPVAKIDNALSHSIILK